MRLRKLDKLEIALLIISLISGAALLLSALIKKNNPELKNSSVVTSCLKIDAANTECDYKLDIADTNSERIQGLSGRQGLEDKTGMLFDFENPAQQCFWMKDMKFSIDMVWLNQNKEIIKIENAVSPETYPNSYCADDTKYVIELQSGEAQKQGFITGKQLSF